MDMKCAKYTAIYAKTNTGYSAHVPDLPVCRNGPNVGAYQAPHAGGGSPALAGDARRWGIHPEPYHPVG